MCVLYKYVYILFDLEVPVIRFQKRQDIHTHTHTYIYTHETNTPCLRALAAFSFITARPFVFVTSTGVSLLKNKKIKKSKKKRKKKATKTT